jgi:hypothetical protein
MDFAEHIKHLRKIEVRPEDTYRIQGKVVAVTKDKKTKII